MAERLLHALLLAGGQSRRMGQDKAALQIAGESQLERTAHLLRSIGLPVSVSVRADQRDDPLRSQFDLVVDSLEDYGPLAGIHAALKLRACDWLIVACDLPRLDKATLEKLIAAHQPTHNATAIRSEYDNLPEPLCAIWTPALLPAVEAAMAQNLRCPRKLLIQAEAVLVEPGNTGALDNANTPADLERILDAAAQ